MVGETEIETDRRIVRDRISLLKDKIKTIDKQMGIQRSNRGAMVRRAGKGYTNVGKSTLMNAEQTNIWVKAMFCENKLFATLDTTVRKWSSKLAFGTCFQTPLDSSENCQHS